MQFPILNSFQRFDLLGALFSGFLAGKISLRFGSGSLFRVLAFCCCLAWSVASRVHAQAPVVPTAGDGLTTATAYQITELGNLVWLGERAAANETAGKYYQLMNDIDASATVTWNDAGTTTETLEGFRPISFRGTFNGDGKRIIGLTINRFEMDNVGLFSNINAEGRVLNLTLENSTIRGRAYVGNLVGHLYDGQVKDCSATGSVIGRSRIGGLVGDNASGTVANCSVAGSATGDSFVGGLVGDNYDSGRIVNSSATGTVVGNSYVGGLAGENNTSCIIDRCFVTGSVTANSNLGGLVGLNNSAKISNSFATGAVTGGWNAGGLVGIDSSGTIENCFATGQVIDGDNVGGLVGNSSSVKIANCFATGTVSGMENVGGLVGNNRGTIDDCFAIGAVTGRKALGGLVGVNAGTVTHSYWDVETTGQNVSAGSDAGYGKITAQMKDASTTFGWNFSSVWGIVEGVSYPYLQFAPPPFRLNVTLQGPGAVTPAPPSGPYAAGTSLTLTATPAGADTVFLGWTGLVAQPTSQSTALLMDTHKSVTARFRGYYEIRTLAELQAIATGDLGGHYVLMNDIEASDTVNWNDAGTDAGAREGFRPIGTIANPSATSFQGIFDGNGKRIIGLTINRPGENGVGLFGCIGASGSVRNLILEGGGVAGKEYVGTLAGRAYGGRVEGCAATGSITGLKLTGGLVGYHSGGTIENCYATGEVTGNLSVGGLIGGNSQSFVRNSFAIGEVTGSSYVGGLVGSSPQSTVTACYWDKATTGQVVSAGSDAGFGKTTSEMKQMTTFAGWDFASVWGIVEGQSDPYLRFSPPPFRLNVSIVGPGTVTLNPLGGVYVPGTPVTLTATPAAGARFAGWTGAGTSETVLSISLLMDAPKGVTAHFRQNHEIRTLAELQAIATAGDFDGYYTLMDDLDASDTANWNDAGTTDTLREGFRPIGMASSAPLSYFRGVFDGNGKKIAGLTINRPGASHAGLFALLGRGGKIRDLTLENVRVTGDTNVGALVAYNAEGTVVNCSASGPVTGQFYTGGLVGYNYYGALVDCVTAGLVSGGSYMDPFTGGSCAGGLLGYNYYGSIENGVTSGQVLGDGPIGGLVGVNEYGTIATSYATGAVAETDGKNYWIAGGLVGYNKYGTVVQSFATGSVTGAVKYGSGSGFEYNRLGGLIGYNYGTVKDCFATGAVTETATSQPYLGGLIGLDYSSQEVTHCFATGRVLTLNKNNSFAGGLIGIGGRLKACYWDVEATGRTTSSCGAGGMGKTSTEMKHQATFQPGGGTGATDWDFTSVWGIVEGQSYPYLRFAPAPFQLAVSIQGEGSVTLDPPGGVYAPGTTVTLTATVAPGYRFGDWTGPVTDQMSFSTQIALDTHKSVTAHFLRVYEIRTLAELQGIDQGDSEGYFLLMNDLDASETATWNDTGTDTRVLEGFRPICSKTPFHGVFDGNGKTISGLTINRSLTSIGLFSSVDKKGRITNLNLTGGRIIGTRTGSFVSNANAGILIGSNAGEVTRCFVSGRVEGGSDTVGGLAGYNAGLISGCRVNTLTANGNNAVGGLVGKNDKGTIVRCIVSGGVESRGSLGGVAGISAGGTIEQCLVSGVIKAGYRVGGLVRYQGSSGVISNCLVTGPVTGQEYVGGLAGEQNFGSMINCFAAGRITGSSSVGGLIGNNSNGTVTACYWDRETTGKSTSSGSDASFGKTTAEMKQKPTFAGWDFTSVWGIVEGQSYPYLRSLESDPPLFQLDVPVQNLGSVTLNPAGGVYAPGTVVTLTATPGTEHHFEKWSGAVADPTALSTTVVMDADKSVMAHFAPNEYALTVECKNGYVAKSPYAETYYPYGTTVTLTASPETGYRFTGWSGPVSDPAAEQTTVFIDGNKTVTAHFEIDAYLLTIEAENGSVTKSPDQTTYTYGTVVTLTATPDPGYHFISWSGSVVDLMSTVTTLVMDSSMTITARFRHGYEIRTLTELQAIATGDLEGYYTLMNDLDVSATAHWNDTGTTTDTREGFLPIGKHSYPDTTSFRGVFEGNGKKITGLTINRSDLNSVGLFGVIGTGGAVRNLTLENETVTGGNCTGPLVGNNDGAITRCKASGSVTGYSSSGNDMYVGGLIGVNGGPVKNSFASGLVTNATGSASVGGLLGGNGGTVADSSATATVTGNDRSGGLIGRNFGHIKNCSATGAVTGMGGFLGGLAGENTDFASIQNSFATGAVTGKAGNPSQKQNLGGLVGNNDGTLACCFATGSVTGAESNQTASLGGLVGSNNDGTVTDCFAVGAVAGAETGTTSYVGGLIGFSSYSGPVTNCYAAGTVTGTGSYIGGFIGLGGTSSGCYWDRENSGQTVSDGGWGILSQTTAEMKRQATFQSGGGTGTTDWNFSTVWGIVEGQTYPYLRFAPPRYRVTVGVEGKGSVVLNPAGGACYSAETAITLTARPGVGARFVRWTGDVPAGSAEQNPLQRMISGNTTLTVRFESVGPEGHPAVWMVR